MAKVSLELSNHPLSREENGVQFIVRDVNGGAKQGELLVSKGGLRWWSRNQKGEPHFISWRRFDSKMREERRR